MIRKYSKKGFERRKEERKDLPEFFQRHIKIIKDTKGCCQECGERLKGDFSEVAHILPKGKFKSISTDDSNVIYLCGMFSNNQCHYKFDNLGVEDIKIMNIYPYIVLKVKKLREVLTEKLTWKDLEKY